MEETINYKVAISIAIILNIPAYLLVGFTKLSLYLSPIPGLGLTIALVFVISFLSFWYLNRFSSGFYAKNGLLFGLTLSATSLICDVLVIAVLLDYGLNFFQWWVVVAYMEILIVPWIFGAIFKKPIDHLPESA